MTRYAPLALLGLATALASGCATARAAVIVAPPVTLDMPIPPARVVIAQPLEPGEHAPVADPSSVPWRPASGGTKPTAEKVDPAAPTPVPETPPTVQPPAVNADLDRTTSERLEKAQRELDTLNPAELTAEAQALYQRAKSFIQQARAALQNRNYPYAELLSKNAATIASALRKLSASISS